MAAFSAKSLACLATCDPRLRAIAAEAIKRIDFTVICGHRSLEEQDAAYRAKRSKLPPGCSPHNAIPSRAFDFVPYPFVDAGWKDVGKFRTVAAVLCAVAKEQGIKARWGGNWSDDVSAPLGHFVDADHFEVVG